MSTFQEHLRSVPAKDLAKATNLPLRTIYRWRNGENEPGAFTQGYLLRVILKEMKPKKILAARNRTVRVKS